MGLSRKEMEKFIVQTIDDGKRRKMAVELVEKDNYRNLFGFYTMAPADYDSPVEIPEGWGAAMELEHRAVDRFLKKFKSLEGVIYGEGGFIKSGARGKNRGAKAMIHVAKWLVEEHKAKCFFLNLTGVYMLKGLQREGFTLEFTSYYDEFEYKGKKPYASVKPSPYGADPKRAGAYLMAVYKEDVMRVFKNDQRPRL